MIDQSSSLPLVESMLLELATARARLDHSKERSRGSAVALEAFAHCEEIERLCRQAAACPEPVRRDALLRKSSARLDELHKLLGPQ